MGQERALVALDPQQREVRRDPFLTGRRQHRPPCPGHSSRASSTGLLAHPSPALHHSGTSSSSYLCKALEQHSCSLLGLEKGRAEGGRATASLLASPHPAPLHLYRSWSDPRSTAASHLSWWLQCSWRKAPGCSTAMPKPREMGQGRNLQVCSSAASTPKQ